MNYFDKLIITLGLLILPLISVEGQWQLTVNGLQAEEGLVLEAEGNQAELYKRVKDHLFKTYTSPKDVISENQPTSIRVASNEPQRIHRNGMHLFDLKYSILLEFKDDRIRMMPPTFELTTTNSGKFQRLHLVYGADITGYDLGIYSEDGKLKSKRAKEDLETFFNGWTDLLRKALKIEDSW